MQQIIDGLKVEVVEFDTMPELPITGWTKEENANRIYKDVLDRVRGNIENIVMRRNRNQGDYADALTQAIQQGIVTEPGKYAIHIDTYHGRWQVFKVIE